MTDDIKEAKGTERFEEIPLTKIHRQNQQEFIKILNHPNQPLTPIIVLANKQDLDGAISPGEVALELDMVEEEVNKLLEEGITEEDEIDTINK